jgi:glycosyl transferase family 25
MSRKPLTQKIPVFVISLSRSIERRDRIKKIMADQGISLSFVDAVDGRELNNCRINEIRDRSNYFKNQRKRNLSRGEIGCALSHLKIYKHIIDNDIEYALIFEDDIDILSESVLKEILFTDSLIKNKNWDLLQLGYYQKFNTEYAETFVSFKKDQLIENVYMARPAIFCSSTFAYVIRKNAASILFEYGHPARVPSDFLTGDSAKLGIDLKLIVPKIIGHTWDYGTIHEPERYENTLTSSKTVFKKVVRKLNYFYRNYIISYLIKYGFIRTFEYHKF